MELDFLSLDTCNRPFDDMNWFALYDVLYACGVGLKLLLVGLV